MSFTCPKCRRQLYNRRRPNCPFCGSSVPSALRIPQSKAALIEKMKADEARRHREFMEDIISPGSGGGWIGVPGSDIHF